MKKVISILAIAGMAVAGVSCNTTAVKEKEAALKAQQYTIDSMKLEVAKKQVVDSMNEVAKTQMVIPQVIPSTPVVQEVRHVYVAPKKRKATHTRTVYQAPANDYVATQPQAATVYQQPTTQYAPVTEQVPVEQRKKGWSAKAKGAAIGAGVGALGGAIINGRNRGVGALIGAGVGALGGLGTGAVIDKRNGR